MILEILESCTAFACGTALGYLSRYLYNNWNFKLDLEMNLINLQDAIPFDYFIHGFTNENFSPESFGRRRNQLRDFLDQRLPEPTNIKFEHFQLQVEDDPDHLTSIYLSIVTPKEAENKKTPLILYFHGGGFVWGDWKEKYPTAIHLSETGYRVIYLEYRLSPEVTIPAQQYDMRALVHWLNDHGEEHGIDLNRMVAIGQSAGGGLVPAFQRIFREEHGKGKVLGHLLLYPSLLGGHELPSYRKRAYGNGINFHHVVVLYNLVYKENDDYYDDYNLNFAITTDYSGFPKTYIYTCEYDIIQDSGYKYYNVLKANHVDAEYIVWKDTVHGFFDTGKKGKQVMKEMQTLMKQICSK